MCLLWHGGGPFLQTVISYAKSLGITVSVQKRSMSAKQISQALDKIMSNKGKYKNEGFTVTSVAGVTADYDGLVISCLHFDEDYR